MTAPALRLFHPTVPQPDRPLFVFLPGMDGTGELLAPQLPGLADDFDIRCLAIPPNDLTDWTGLVKQTASLIQAEQRWAGHRPIYLCGESFGGCLALQLAAHFHNLCDRLILVNPASSFHRRPWMAWGAAITPWLPDALYRLSTLGLLPFLINPERVDPKIRQTLLTTMQSVTPASAAWRIELLNQFSLEALPLKQIEQPSLVLAATADRLLPSASEADLLVNYLPQAQKILLPDSGHACLLENEVHLANLLRRAGFQPKVQLATPTPAIHKLVGQPDQVVSA